MPRAGRWAPRPAAPLAALVACLAASLALAPPGPGCAEEGPSVEILHPADGQVLSAAWQDLVVPSIRCFRVPSDGVVAVYVDGALASVVDRLPMSIAGLQQLADGREHSLALSLQAAGEVLAEHEVAFTWAAAPPGPPPFDFPRGFPPSIAAEATFAAAGGGWSGAEPLTVVWTCPDWEVDWISELLGGAGLAFSLVRDASLATLAPNALVAVSHNDLAARDPDALPAYLLRLRARGGRVGVLHMSDETYSGASFFYPWAHYVLRNHWSAAHAALPHLLALPLGYKKGFHTAPAGAAEVLPERDLVWSFVGQVADKPTRAAMLRAVRGAGRGYERLTSRWDDPAGLHTHEYRHVLQRTKFVLCPRGFVHPDSFRLSEALEAGGVPLIEDDAYFDGLLGTDHPLPRLPPPPGCPRPNTTSYHEPPYPPAVCADVWGGVGGVIEGLLPRFEEVQAHVAAWWAAQKRALKARVRALVLGGGGGG